MTSLLRVDGRVVVPFRATSAGASRVSGAEKPDLRGDVQPAKVERPGTSEQRWQPRHGEPSSTRAALQESPSVTPRLSSPPLRLLSGGEGLLVRDTASPKSERRGI